MSENVTAPDELISPESILENIKTLKELATSNVLYHQCIGDWVSIDWCEKHFGSSTEARFVTAANPIVVFALLKQIDDLNEEVKMLKRRVLISRESRRR